MIVFLSETTKNIQRTFELGAFRFLLRPINKKELYSYLNDALDKAVNECAIVYDGKTKKIIKLKDIQYIEAGTKGTIVRNANDTYCSKNTMAKWEEALANS